MYSSDLIESIDIFSLSRLLIKSSEVPDGESILFEDALQDNPTGYGGRVQYEKGSQDADGVIKIRVNGEDKFIQLYNSPGSQGY